MSDAHRPPRSTSTGAKTSRFDRSRRALDQGLRRGGPDGRGRRRHRPSNALALAIATAVRAEVDAGWGAPIPAYDSVLVPFDPDRLDPIDAEARLWAYVAEALEHNPTDEAGRLHRIPGALWRCRMAPTSAR